jgi:hypothetical protein
VQSVAGFLLRLRPDWDLVTSWEPVTRTPLEQLVSQIVVLVTYAFAAAACLLARKGVTDAAASARRREFQYLLVICLALVASPLSWSHYYCWLLIPAAFFLGERVPPGRLARTLGWAAMFIVTPLVIWPHDFGNGLVGVLYRTLALSNLLLGGLLWFGLVAWWLARSGTTTPAAKLVAATQ